MWHDGWAPKIIFSGSRGALTRDSHTENEADVYKKIAIENGVNQSAILVENKATNTGENVTLASRLLKQCGIDTKTIILVGKPYMLRRHYATFLKQWPYKQVPKIICSAIDLSMDGYTRNSYISLEYMTNIMVGDLQRIKEYPKLGFQIEQEIPEEVWAAYEELVRRGYTKHLLQGTSL